LNIGIDATSWWNNRGFGRFTRDLLAAMFQLDTPHHFYLFTDQEIPELERLSNVSVQLVQTSRPTTEAAVADSNRSPVDMLRMHRAVSDSSIDVMFFPTVYSWYPVPGKIPTLLTVMDAIAEHYPQLIFPSWKSRFFWWLKMRGALWNSNRVLTISHAAKEEIVEYIGVNPTVIDVGSAAPNKLFQPRPDSSEHESVKVAAGLPLDEPFMVYVGGLAPHKNLEGLLDGFEAAISSGEVGAINLAIVGDFAGAGFHSNYESLAQRVKGSKALENRVYFTGYLSDEQLVALYSSSLAAVMPSFSEGYGLPAIEALACSAPLLCSNGGALPEVAGEAAHYFDPFDSSSIAQGIIRIVNDPALREDLALKAKARADIFTWPKAAQQALVFLEQLSQAEKRST
jgi:glycosyltransferase involved in cell wall biosynthesis